jgi:uncharacterized protein
MELSDLHFISWENFHNSSFSLAEKIKQSGEKFDIIIAISRGGLVLARILSDFLDLPIYNISIESYVEINKAKEPRVTQDIGSADIKNKKILLVDEICDSGKTFERAVAYLYSVGVSESLTSHGEGEVEPLQLKTACLVLKSHSSFAPDFYEEKIDKWVVFPYEVRETVEELRNKISSDDFVKLGFNEKLVNKFVQR